MTFMSAKSCNVVMCSSPADELTSAEAPVDVGGTVVECWLERKLPSAVEDSKESEELLVP